MARLETSERAGLPNTAFAYVDSRGRRRLPIHDESHVRNALARFSQVEFEDEAARERARTRLLKAAKKYGIVPVGFIAGQLQTERVLGHRSAHQRVELPTGFVTMLMTDIEGSTALVQQIGDGYRQVIDDVWSILRGTSARFAGATVETRADEFFAVFASPADAVTAAVAIQLELGERRWSDGVDVRVRVGVHSGWPTRTDDNYIGIPVHVASRVCGVAHGGQIVTSGDTREAVKGATLDGVRFRSLGAHKLRGLPDAVDLFQIAAKGLPTRFPPPRRP